MVLSHREALNQAMREEMRRTLRIFLIGEKWVLQGAFKVTKDSSRSSGRSGGGYADYGSRVYRVGDRGGHGGSASDRRTDDDELRHCGLGSNREQRGKIRYMSGGQLSVPW